MNFALKMMNFAFKMIQFVLSWGGGVRFDPRLKQRSPRTRPRSACDAPIPVTVGTGVSKNDDFALQFMNFALKRMNFVFKMMNFGRPTQPAPRRWSSWPQVKRSSRR